MPLSSLNKQCEKLRPTTTIPSNFVNNLHNETLTVGSAAQGGLRMGPGGGGGGGLFLGDSPPPPPPLTITYLRRKKYKKRTDQKKKLSKGCNQCQNVTVLDFPERLEFRNCYCRPTMVAIIFMVPPL